MSDVSIPLGPGPIEVNKEFEVGKMAEYADGTMNSWVHHVQYILPQVHAHYMYCHIHYIYCHTHTITDIVVYYV